MSQTHRAKGEHAARNRLTWRWHELCYLPFSDASASAVSHLGQLSQHRSLRETIMSVSSKQCSQCKAVSTYHAYLADDVSAHDMSYPRFPVVLRGSRDKCKQKPRAELRQGTSMPQSPVSAHRGAGSAHFEKDNRSARS